MIEIGFDMCAFLADKYIIVSGSVQLQYMGYYLKLFCLRQNCPAQTGQNFAFSMMKSAPAWKKYTIAKCDGCE